MIYNFLTIPIEIKTLSPEIYNNLEDLYGEFRDDNGCPPKTRFLAISEEENLIRPTIYKIYRNGFFVCQDHNKDEFLLRLETMIMDEIVKGLPHFYFIHAAVLANEHGAIIFPGPSGAGKSTLAMALSERNFSYLSDEIAPIEKDTHRVYPFPRGIKLRTKHVGLVSVTKGMQHNSSQRNYFNICKHTSKKPGTINKVKYILFPQYNPHEKPGLIPVSKAYTVSILAKCSVHFGMNQGDCFLFLVEFVNKINCYKLITNDLEESCLIIKKLLG